MPEEFICELDCALEIARLFAGRRQESRSIQMVKGFRTVLMVLCMACIAPLAQAGEVNINKADAAALQENLKGVGPAKAKAIVDYRSQNGEFKSIEDLAKVKGVGPALIKKNRSDLSLSGGATTASKTGASAKSASKQNAANKTSSS